MNRKSNWLKVLVLNNGEEIVNVTMPIYSLSILDTIIPEYILKKILDKGLDLKKIISTIKEDNYTPQTVFEEKIDKTNKEYKVWIE